AHRSPSRDRIGIGQQRQHIVWCSGHSGSRGPGRHVRHSRRRATRRGVTLSTAASSGAFSEEYLWQMSSPRDPYESFGPSEAEEIEAAAREAAAIGGRAGDEDLDPALRPLIEAGEGEAEGFELAEQDLIEAAEHGSSTADPLGDAFTPEVDGRNDVDTY